MEKSEGKRSMWLVFAVLSAVFAALTSILAKVGIDNVNSNLATAIPHPGGAAHGLGDGFCHRSPGGLGQITQRSLVFLVLSGLATGASWLCYYRAVQLGACPRWCPSIK